ncbi:hypothetical protein D4764_17G0006540 [Takifugu flavidus]|uniref:CCHC-type domain-containing protein n=1 Tax=Takifugu flavidus TaxID=433684 RepID=A0A5C6NX35_9TELE|nr:hypothetical protein D4764_17G0006540 [Takifugu flavidus]
MPVMAAASGVSEFEKLTTALNSLHRPVCPWRSAPWLTDKVDQLVVAGVVVNDEHTPVFPPSNPAKKNGMLLRELSRHGRVVSPMRLIPLGSKSPLLSHAVSFRRQVSMVLNNNKEGLNMALRFRVDDFYYTVFVTTDPLKCFGCGEEGHVIRESAQNARSDAGTTVEVEEPAELQGDHLDLQTESLTRELVEQTTTRMTETVLDMEDVGVEENSHNVSIKRKTTDTKVKNDKERDSSWDIQEASGYNDDIQVEESIKLYMKSGDFSQPSFTHQETYRLKKLMVKVQSRLESAD